jgi:hypothetical protein
MKFNILKVRRASRCLFPTVTNEGPLGRPRRRWVDNIKMDLGEVGWGDVEWIGLASFGFHEMLGNYRVA